MFEENFRLGRENIRLITNNPLILQEINSLLPRTTLPLEPQASLKLSLLTASSVPFSLNIPSDCRPLCSEPLTEHFLCRGLWFINFGDLGKMVIDLDARVGLGFVHPDQLEQDPWIVELFLHPMFEFLRRNGGYLVHAGAVSLAGQGFLFPGESRSGKTTLVLHLLRQGFKYLADDRCFLERQEDGFGLRSFPAEVNVYPPNIAEVPELQGILGNGGSPYDTKKSFRIEELYPEKIVSEAKLEAIVFPRWHGTGDTRVEALAANQALEELLPLTLEPFFPDTLRAHFNFVGDLVESRPAFRIMLGSDKDRWGCLIKNLL